MMMKKNNHLNVDRVQSNPCIDRDGEESEPIKLDIYSMDRTALRKMVVDIWSPQTQTPLFKKKKKKKDLTCFVKKGFLDALKVSPKKISPNSPNKVLHSSQTSMSSLSESVISAGKTGKTSCYKIPIPMFSKGLEHRIERMHSGNSFRPRSEICAQV